MLGGFRDGALELGGPGVERLARPRIDQIERIAVEDRARDRDRVERLLRAMQAAEFLQRGIVERLHAKRNAIDAGGAIAAEARGLHAGRIGLQRHFDIGCDAPVLADRNRGSPAPIDGCISDGVPPPKKIVDTVRPGTRAAVAAISVSKARTKRCSSTPPWRTWLLKSQYGHFDRQNGQCT